jgi:hypothetical protein
MTPLIFLDIDGCLNSKQSCSSFFNKNIKKYGNRNNAPNWLQWGVELPARKHIKALNEILNKTGAEIVISSMWRDDFSDIGWNYFFRALGIKGYVRGKTPRIQSAGRGNEIAVYLEGRKENYVILDDDYDYDYDHIKQHWLVIPNDTGLGKEHIQPAIDIINGKLL